MFRVVARTGGDNGRENGLRIPVPLHLLELSGSLQDSILSKKRDASVIRLLLQRMRPANCISPPREVRDTLLGCVKSLPFHPRPPAGRPLRATLCVYARVVPDFSLVRCHPAGVSASIRVTPSNPGRVAR